MASLTKLRKRLLRWTRYAAATGAPHPRVLELHFRVGPVRAQHGHLYAWWQVRAEVNRRRVRNLYPPDGSSW